MLLPAILGDEFQAEYKKAMSGSIPDFFFIQNNNLHKVLKSIIESNQRHGNLTSHEETVQLFLNRSNQLLNHLQLLQDHPDVALSQWRTFYELVVCFRVWTQPITISQDSTAFLEMSQRFLDYEKITKIKVYNHKWTHEEREIELKYRNKGKHLVLDFDYDWLNPAFSEQELKRRQQKYHNSFRDLVWRTKWSDSQLLDMLDYYIMASTVLHFNPVSMDVASVIKIEDVNHLFFQCSQSLLSDYLNLLKNLYPLNEKLIWLQTLINSQLSQIKRA